MNKKDKAALTGKLYELIGVIVNIEELRLKSTTDDEDAALNHMVLSIHSDIGVLAESLKIDL